MFKAKKTKQYEAELKYANTAGRALRKSAYKMIEKGVPISSITSAMLGVGIELSLIEHGGNAETVRKYLDEVSSALKYHRNEVETKNSGQLDA